MFVVNGVAIIMVVVIIHSFNVVGWSGWLLVDIIVVFVVIVFVIEIKIFLVAIVGGVVRFVVVVMSSVVVSVVRVIIIIIIIIIIRYDVVLAILKDESFGRATLTGKIVDTVDDVGWHWMDGPMVTIETPSRR